MINKQQTTTTSIFYGLIGGLLGTVVMDLVMFGLFLIMGESLKSWFSLIGETASIIFSYIGIEIGEFFILGTVLHYSIGLFLGLIFGVIMFKYKNLQIASTLKCIVLGVLATEIFGTALLVAMPIVLELTTSDTIRIFSLSIMLHSINGILLGLVVKYGLRSYTVNLEVSAS